MLCDLRLAAPTVRLVRHKIWRRVAWLLKGVVETSNFALFAEGTVEDGGIRPDVFGSAVFGAIGGRAKVVSGLPTTHPCGSRSVVDEWLGDNALVELWGWLKGNGGIEPTSSTDTEWRFQGTG